MINYHESQFPSPTRTIVLNEYGIAHDNRWEVLPWTGQLGWSPSAKMNVALMDGHACALTVDRAFIRTSYAQCETGYDFHWFKNQRTLSDL